MTKKIIVIGGGPGGYVAAIRGAQLGASVTVIETNRIGGTCLNDGCIPTKALYKSASLYHDMAHMAQFGIEIDGCHLDMAGVQRHKQQVVDTLVDGVAALLKANRVEVIQGIAHLLPGRQVAVESLEGETTVLAADGIIIATGSEPMLPKIEGMNLEGVVTSEQILKFDHVPKRLAIIGGGVIGMEFAGIFNAFGSEVTVVEFADQILGQLDAEIVKRYGVLAKKQGITVHKQTKAKCITKVADQGLVCTCEGKKGDFDIESDQILVSVGRIPRIGALNLDQADIKYTLKGIEVTEHFETNQAGIYAIGDCNGKTMLAHAASHQAIEAVDHFMGVLQPHSASHIPSCVFVNPEIASVGLTEEAIKERGITYLKSKFMFGANGKALTMGEGEGLIKVLSDENGVLLGVHIMGPHASDLIHEAALALHQSLDVNAIKGMIHAHPTLSEAFHEAVLGLKGEAIHLAPLKK
jgi:dihydrolipoamide dehydrogenase